MNIHLAVVRSFGPHAKGDRITDATDIAVILAGENSDKVVRLSAPDVAVPNWTIATASEA